MRARVRGRAAERERVRSAFTQVYLDNGWADPESRSGPGSTLARTATLREEFPALLAELQVTSLLDVGCGDFNWMRTVDLGGVDYLGVDVVRELIAENERRFGGPRRRFLALEIASEVPPRADLALCRDCWVHLSDSQVLSAIANLRTAGVRYVLATTFVDRMENPDVPTAGWRPMNLALPPFRLGRPLLTLSENRTVEEERYRDKSLGLWALSLPHKKKPRTVEGDGTGGGEGAETTVEVTFDGRAQLPIGPPTAPQQVSRWRDSQLGGSVTATVRAG